MPPFELKTELVSISEGVWAIDQGMVRSFLIVGTEQALLVDTGAAPCAMDEMIRTVTPLPLTVVHSHTDGDHTANDRLFSTIYLNPADLPHMREKAENVNYLPISEGNIFDLGGRQLQVIDAPGHTPGSICLLDVENRILFSGDTVSHGPVFLFGRGRDIPGFRATLEKLKALPGYDLVYPCHEECPVGREVIDELMQAVDGALDGSIAPAENDTPMPPDAGDIKVYRCGKSGVLMFPPA